jgi:hypothetical protein
VRDEWTEIRLLFSEEIEIFNLPEDLLTGGLGWLIPGAVLLYSSSS